MSGGDGNCFPVAMKLAKYMRDEHAHDAWNLRVVHGTPLGQGEDNLGLRYWHAWVECTTSAGQMVFDMANGKTFVMKRAEYYRKGKLLDKGGNIFRYTLDEAEDNALNIYEHLGPWVPNADELCEV